MSGWQRIAVNSLTLVSVSLLVLVMLLSPSVAWGSFLCWGCSESDCYANNAMSCPENYCPSYITGTCWSCKCLKYTPSSGEPYCSCQ
jgi:hypothetical protein